jgi:hypothetical protein
MFQRTKHWIISDLCILSRVQIIQYYVQFYGTSPSEPHFIKFFCILFHQVSSKIHFCYIVRTFILELVRDIPCKLRVYLLGRFQGGYRQLVGLILNLGEEFPFEKGHCVPKYPRVDWCSLILVVALFAERDFGSSPLVVCLHACAALWCEVFAPRRPHSLSFVH